MYARGGGHFVDRVCVNNACEIPSKGSHLPPNKPHTIPLPLAYHKRTIDQARLKVKRPELARVRKKLAAGHAILVQGQGSALVAIVAVGIVKVKTSPRYNPTGQLKGECKKSFNKNALMTLES
jgi:hypothetical protein